MRCREQRAHGAGAPACRAGFTLIELLLGISIISALAAVVIIAVNPTRQFAKARNTERRSEIHAILEAVQQHALGNGGLLAAGIDGTWRMLGTESTGCNVLCGQGGLTQVALSPTADAYIYQFTPGTNYGADPQIQEYPWSPSWTKRGIIRFDLSVIPASATVNAATLSLREAAAYGVGTQTVALHRMTRVWTENGVTWSTSDGTVPWTAMGGDFVATPTATTNITWTGSPKWDAWNVLSDVQAFLGGTQANHGWIIKDNVEDASQAYWYFHARETVTSAYRPTLVVDYTAATDAGGATPAACTDLATVLVPLYLPLLPTDPRTGTPGRTQYAIRRTTGDRIAVRACGVELGEDIVLSR